VIPAERDLIGALRGQALLAEFPDPIAGLTRLEGPFPRLDEFLAAEVKAPRLGNYFEALIKYALVQLLGMKRVHSNVPIPGETGQTLGEMDFVYEGVHLEVATKFYLYWNPEGGPPETRHFLGTMVRDRLDLKLEKLKSRQLTITQRPEARAVLERLAFGEVSSRALVRGRLFYPLAAGDWRTHPSPPEVAAAHDRGWWCHARDLDPVRFAPETRWQILPRLNWMAAEGLWEPPTEGAWLTTAALVAQPRERPRLVVELQPAGGGLYREVSRGMLVPDEWPDVREIY